MPSARELTNEALRLENSASLSVLVRLSSAWKYAALQRHAGHQGDIKTARHEGSWFLALSFFFIFSIA